MTEDELRLEDEPRVRVQIGHRECWCTPLAARALENEYRRVRMRWGPPRPKRTGPRARKTHCIHGHPLSGPNLREYRYGNEIRHICIACMNGRNRKRG